VSTEDTVLKAHHTAGLDRAWPVPRTTRSDALWKLIGTPVVLRHPWRPTTIASLLGMVGPVARQPRVMPPAAATSREQVGRTRLDRVIGPSI